MSVNIEIEDAVNLLWSDGALPRKERVNDRLGELIYLKSKNLPELESFTHLRGGSDQEENGTNKYQRIREKFIEILRHKLRQIVCEDGKIKQKYQTIKDSPFSPPSIALLATIILNVDSSYGVDISVLSAIVLANKMSNICLDESQ